MSLISTPQHTKANRHNLKNKSELESVKESCTLDNERRSYPVTGKRENSLEFQ